MEAREAQPGDWKRIEELHAAGGYKFELPPADEIAAAYVVVEDGKIVAWAAGQLQFEVFDVVDFGLSPHRRIDALRRLHPPLAKKAQKLGAVRATANIDPTYPALTKRLLKFGWVKPLWTQVSIRIDAVLGKEDKSKCA
jgi:hypothetical protein